MSAAPFSVRLRATLATWIAFLGALLAWLPFVPGILRALLVGKRDRERMFETLRSGLHEKPADVPDVGTGPCTVFLVAGEPSGDLHAADLASALTRANPEVTLVGLGGPKMEAAGVRLLADLVSDPVMGVIPVLKRIPFFFRIYRDVLVHFETEKPDVFVGVDYPGLNTRLGRAARKRGIRSVAYIAPQVWAWAVWRGRKLAKAFDRILAILPFEPKVFATFGGEAVYVGHPLFEHLANREVDDDFAQGLRDDMGSSDPLIALLPGSRRSEVDANLPLLLAAADWVAREKPDARFVIPLATERLRTKIESRIAAVDLDVLVADPVNSDDAMHASDAAMAVSGTASLHLVHHGTPSVICYRTNRRGLLLAKGLLVAPFIALPNLLCGREIFPEFLIATDDGAALGRKLLEVLPGGSKRRETVATLEEITRRLHVPGVPDRAARLILDRRARAR